MDNPEKLLYDSCKSLIFKAWGRDAQKFSNSSLPDARLSLPALDNHVDNRGQALYDTRKSLIFQAMAPIAQKTGSLETDLSMPALDNHVDNSEQALYDSGKSLICKAFLWIAQKKGNMAASGAWLSPVSERYIFDSWKPFQDHRPGMISP